MARLDEWVEGARPRTLPAALAPVLGGSAVAWFEGAFSLLLAGLALVVALALQLGVNYANDYSDGIRGTDAERIGPLRLVGSGVAIPVHVRSAAFACFGVAAIAGIAVVVLTGHWWLPWRCSGWRRRARGGRCSAGSCSSPSSSRSARWPGASPAARSSPS